MTNKEYIQHIIAMLQDFNMSEQEIADFLFINHVKNKRKYIPPFEILEAINNSEVKKLLFSKI